MSGMAAAIRLAMFGKKTLLLECHRIPGGLNSYYKRGKRQFDVGLHALTNFATPSERKRPLCKLLKQLRIPYSKLELCPQNYSMVQFREAALRFDNDIALLTEEISKNFPGQVDAFARLLEHLESFDETALSHSYRSAKKVVANFITDPLLLEMLFCPPLIYGSAVEDDMDFSQFAIMFKSLYLEGFSRPKGGVRRLIDLLMERLEEVGCEVRFGCGVREIVTKSGQVTGIVTEEAQFIESDTVLSSVGYPETLGLLEETPRERPALGKLSFCESLLCLKERPCQFGQDASIVFYNNRTKYHYRRPEALFDSQSAVVCFPNNFDRDDLDEGLVRVTFIANYQHWKALARPDYLKQKARVLSASLELAQNFLPGWKAGPSFSDVFTPTTIERYTRHFEGRVYGSPDKKRDGRTGVDGLFLCGTDQGFLGIVGSLLSGISMANLHGLKV